jgi:hypothetical protein
MKPLEDHCGEKPGGDAVKSWDQAVAAEMKKQR